SITAAQATGVKPKSGKLPIILSIILSIICGGLIIAIVAARSAIKTLTPSAESNSTPAAAQSPTPQMTESAASQPPTPQPPVAEAMRRINYSVTLRKDPKHYPGGAPILIPGEVIFSPGDRVHFSFISPQHGYLYIINESPEAKGRASSFTILFPS